MVTNLRGNFAVSVLCIEKQKLGFTRFFLAFLAEFKFFIVHECPRSVNVP